MTATPLSVVYLLEGTDLFGGVKVPIHHANLLAARGHRVTVVSKGDRPDWYAVSAEFRKVSAFEPASLPPADVTVATFWTTIRAAAAVPSGQAVHYCQGFEATYTHNVTEHPAIIEAYKTAIPCLAVSPHLAALVRDRFGRPSRMVPPALAPYWRTTWRWHPHRPARVLVVSPMEIDWKGVATGLTAVRLMRSKGLNCRLVRLSQWPLSDAERSLLAPDEFHHHLLPHQVARLVRGVDILLAPSWDQEGFGLPVLEAMACGSVVVTSSGTVMEEIAGGTALVCPPGDAHALASTIDQAISLEGVARAEFARRARVRAETFTWAASVDRHLEAYALAVGT